MGKQPGLPGKNQKALLGLQKMQGLMKGLKIPFRKPQVVNSPQDQVVNSPQDQVVNSPQAKIQQGQAENQEGPKNKQSPNLMESKLTPNTLDNLQN